MKINFRFLKSYTLAFLILILTVYNTNNILSQQYIDKEYSPRTSFGLFANGGINQHSAELKKLQGLNSCCPGYESGSGFGVNFGLFSAIPLSSSLELGLRIQLSDLSGKLSRIESTTISDVKGNAQSGEFEHIIDSKISSSTLALLLQFRMTDQIRLMSGIRLGMIGSATVDTKEQLVSPSNGVFNDTKTRTRNAFTGDIPSASTMEMSIQLGASYDLPLNSSHTLFFVPEVMINLGFSSLIDQPSGSSWTVNTFALGAGIRYAPREYQPPKPPKPEAKPAIIPPMPTPLPPPDAPMLNASIDAVSVDKDDIERPVSTIRVEEFLLNKTHPILKYVFFDENSNKIPNRYKRISQNEKNEFSFKNFYKMKTMDVYYQVLNIVGKRLQFYPQTELTLVGCNSDQGLEKGNKALSDSRAEAVRDFLINEWQISPSRIKLDSRNLPDLPSNPKDPDGIVENRRVEMIANLPQIFEPVIIKDTLRTSNPPHIRFKPKINAQMGLKDWKIVTSQGDKQLRIFEGIGQPPAKIDWEVEKESEQDYVPRLDMPMEYRMVVTDNDGKIWESKKQVLPVTQLTIEKKIDEVLDDKELYKYSIIGFDFNRTELSNDNQLIAETAKTKIRKSSEILIKGYSDKIGNDDLNKKLSQQRADEVAKYLGVDRKFSVGLGEESLLYDNSLPEGRFYSRTVTIDIVTPIQ